MAHGSELPDASGWYRDPAAAKACACNSGGSFRLRSTAVVLLILSAIIVASCDSGSGDIPIRNDTEQTLTVAEVREQGDLDVKTIESGEIGRFNSFAGEAGPFQVRTEKDEPLMTISELSTVGRLPFVITNDELAPNIINDTDVTLILSWVHLQGWELEMTTLEPGRGHAIAGCFEQLVVRTQDGMEYASYAGSMCTDDTWSITEPNLGDR